VAQGLQDAVQETSIPASAIDASGNEYDIRIQYASWTELDHGCRDSHCRTRNGTIRISDVASVIEGRGPVKIDRRNRQRQVTVSAYLARGR
jgi:multidrug efflux pump subunit AcrB